MLVWIIVVFAIIRSIGSSLYYTFLDNTNECLLTEDRETQNDKSFIDLYYINWSRINSETSNFIGNIRNIEYCNKLTISFIRFMFGPILFGQLIECLGPYQFTQGVRCSPISIIAVLLIIYDYFTILISNVFAFLRNKNTKLTWSNVFSFWRI